MNGYTSGFECGLACGSFQSTEHAVASSKSILTVVAIYCLKKGFDQHTFSRASCSSNKKPQSTSLSVVPYMVIDVIDHLSLLLIQF